MSTYQPGIPTGTVNLDVDYQNLQGNFQQLDTSFGVDHLPFSNQTAQNGFHTVVHLLANSTIAGNPPNNQPIVPPAPVGLTGELFTAQINDGINPDEALFFQTGGGRLTQLTRNFAPNPVSNGSTFLPGGLILNYGISNISANPTLTTINFNQPFASPSNVFSIVISRMTADNSTTGQEVRIVTGSVTASLFKVSCSSSSSANIIYWMAVGK